AVFYDPSGRRARQLRWFAIVVAVLAGLLIAGFITSLIISPTVAGFAARHATHYVSPGTKRVHKDYIAARKALERFSMRSTPVPVALHGALAGAYFAPWEDAGLDSFRAHAGELDVVYPTWLSLSKDGRSIITESWDPQNNETTQKLTYIARAHHVRI